MSPSAAFVTIKNCQPLPLEKISPISFEEFRSVLSAASLQGLRLAALFGQRLDGDNAPLSLFALLANDPQGELQVLSTKIDDNYESLTPYCPAAHWFEREIAEQWQVLPHGHPWLKPIRFQQAESTLRPPIFGSPEPRIGLTNFFSLAGEEVHEVAVGPVHAGIIEPGHFRFQCHGEKVYHLEISLGYQHRGIERALRGGPRANTLPLLEVAAGDTSIGHCLAYCQALEALSGQRPTLRVQILRGIALELERLANHTGDLGALAGDVGFLPTMSFCGRIRGDFLNLTALLCGSRFGRSLLRVGGLAYDLDEKLIADLRARLTQAKRDVTVAVDLLLHTPSVMARFEQTGQVSRATAREIGLVGVPARAAGIAHDVRCDFPTGIYRYAQIPISSWHSGDVFSRAIVRWLEIQRSLTFIEEQLSMFPAGAVKPASEIFNLPENTLIISLVEGWRGEICHAVITDSLGCFKQYKVIDPSFHNWFGLALALRGQQISDFPLCNKSFNLSYCGHDL